MCDGVAVSSVVATPSPSLHNNDMTPEGGLNP